MKTALCLSGDGARIPIKAGMLKAYAESGLKHDMLFGTSSGALAGALYHQGDLHELDYLCRTIRNKDVYRIGCPWRPWSKSASFYDSAPLLALIKKLVSPTKLRANPIPYVVNVTDMQMASASSFDVFKCTDTQVYNLLLASASIPVAFPLVNSDVYAAHQSLFADGGMTNDYCVAQAVVAGARRIILMTSLVQEPRVINNWIDALESMISAGIESQLQKEVEVARVAGVEVIIIKPDRPTGVGILDFDFKDKQGLIDLGYRVAKQALANVVAAP